MPRDSRALITARIRTRPDVSPDGPILSWAFRPLQSVRHAPWGRLPVSFPLALSTTHLEETGRPALQGLTGRVTRRFLAVPPALLRFVTRTLPLASLAKYSAPLGCPTGSENAMRHSRPPEGALPVQPRKASPAAATPRRAQGVTPEGHCSHTTLSKRDLQTAKFLWCQLRDLSQIGRAHV